MGEGREGVRRWWKEGEEVEEVWEGENTGIKINTGTNLDTEPGWDRRVCVCVSVIMAWSEKCG